MLIAMSRWSGLIWGSHGALLLCPSSGRSDPPIAISSGTQREAKQMPLGKIFFSWRRRGLVKRLLCRERTVTFVCAHITERELMNCCARPLVLDGQTDRQTDRLTDR